MIGYIDSSYLLARLLGQSSSPNPLTGLTCLISSQLLLVETRRVLDRYRLLGEIDDNELGQLIDNFRAFITQLRLYSITQSVLEKASMSMSVVLGTLDAIHLSTALIYRSKHPNDLVKFISYDKQLCLAAKVQGFECIV